MAAIARAGLAALGTAIVAVGCAGTSEERRFSAGDAQRITSIRPSTADWDWPRHPAQSSRFARDTFGPTEGYLGSAGTRWVDSTKLAHVDANLFKTPAAAHAALPDFRAFARRWAKRDGGRLIDVPVEGLGGEAWRIQAGPADFGEEVTYGWRRGNLVVEAHMQCIFDVCQSDISSAGRAWAEQIDVKARSSS